MTEGFIQPSPSGGVSGERHVSEVAGRPPLMSKKAGIGVIVAGAAVACGAILFTSATPHLHAQEEPKLTIQSAIKYVPPPPPPVNQPAPAPPAPSPPPLPTQATIIPSSAGISPKRDNRLLVYTAATSSSHLSELPTSVPQPDTSGATAIPLGVYSDPAATPAGPTSNSNKQQIGGDLAARLTPTHLMGVSANVLQHQPFLLTTGTMVPCILQTAMDSTLPGFVTCIIPQDILGKTGLTLLDRGTRVVGEFRGGVRQGIERMFVIWTRAETPQGVVINLDSPATDPLGRSGMDGEIDRHFWERFGSALLLSTVDGLIQAGVQQASKSGVTSINTGTTESVGTESLHATIDIPPTISKNQGELVSIFVARDLDFSTVYSVRPMPTRSVRISSDGSMVMP